MIKTITITQFKREPIASKSEQFQLWRYIWQIKDEKQYFRQVIARIIHDVNDQSITFQAANIREMPLVDALLRHQLGSVFTIDFTEFNQKHCYDTRTPYKFSGESNLEQGVLFPIKEKAYDSQIEMHGFI
jgi:hypothetical protein